jgi:hypothetical protein
MYKDGFYELCTKTGSCIATYGMQESNSFTVRSGIVYVATDSEVSFAFELFTVAEVRLLAIINQ